MKRRTLIPVLVAMLATALAPVAWANNALVPGKPIRLLVPSSAGGMSDVVARVYAERMSLSLKTPVVVENMPGAGTMLGVRATARAVPDGHTMVAAANTVVTMPYVDKGANYSPSDFTGVSYLSKAPMALMVSTDSPYKTLADLVAAAKKAPDSITYASVGFGTTSHLPVELFARTAGVKLTLVPYKGISLASPDVIAGRVTFLMGTSSFVTELIKAGRMRALAVTSDARSAMFPDVPTFAELGYPDASYELFIGLLVPAKTPAAIVKALADAAEDAKKDAGLIKRIEATGQELPQQTSAAQFNEFLHKEEQRMKKLVTDANIRVSN